MKVSIDFWGTLGKSSPEFYPKKIELLQEYISADFEEIEAGFLTTKKQLNEIIELSGFQPPIREIFQLLLSNINKGYFRINPTKLNALIEEYQELAEKYHPVIFSEQTFVSIKDSYNEGCDFFLSCNTMLITSMPIINALENWGIYECFQNTMFSCDKPYAKPHFSMYQNSDFHIGDNPITDGFGAILAGSTPIIINSNNQTIQDALNIIRNSK